MTKIAGQLALDFAEFTRVDDDLADLDFERAEKVLAAEAVATAPPRVCRCPSPLIFRPLPADEATCSLCGRPAST